MKSNKPITLPPDDRRCHHLDGVNGSRCPNWAMAGLPFCPKHEPTTPSFPPAARPRPEPVEGGLRGVGRLEDLVDNLFFIQDLLAQAIKSQAQGEALDILTLAELSRNYTHNALNITRTLQAKQALEAPKNEWALLLAELSLELDQEAP